VCRGSGKRVSLLVITDSFGPAEHSCLHQRPRGTEEIAGRIQEDSDYRRAVSIIGDRIGREALRSIENTGLQAAIINVLVSAEARGSDTCRIVRQRLVIRMADVFHIRYDFQGSSYDLHLVGTNRTVRSRMSPFVQLVENGTVWAKTKLEAGKIAEGLRMLERCLEMQQADPAVEAVLRLFRERFADAYAKEAAANGKWRAESCYYSDRAKQMQPGHQGAAAHEKWVAAWLGAITFLPGICAGTIVAISGFAGNRSDVGVTGLVTTILLVILLWFLYGRKALNTALLMLTSLLGETIAGVAFYTIGSTHYPTEEAGWLYSGIAGIVLSVVMVAVAMLLPKNVRRENIKGSEDLRSSLARAQKLFQEDWEDIKASYPLGEFTTTPE